MKKIHVLLLLFMIFAEIIFAQAYLGYPTTTVNFRAEPNINSQILSALSIDEPLFITSKDRTNGFYFVIHIELNTEGYVHSDYINLIGEVPENEEGIFTPMSKTQSYNSTLSVLNDTNLELTLTLNQKRYLFEPKQKRDITLTPGNYSYRASAPGVLPDYGKETIQSNYEYEWTFYIIRR